jgi:hypothetical protein
MSLGKLHETRRLREFTTLGILFLQMKNDSFIQAFCYFLNVLLRMDFLEPLGLVLCMLLVLLSPPLGPSSKNAFDAATRHFWRLREDIWQRSE